MEKNDINSQIGFAQKKNYGMIFKAKSMSAKQIIISITLIAVITFGANNGFFASNFLAVKIKAIKRIIEVNPT